MISGIVRKRSVVCVIMDGAVRKPPVGRNRVGGVVAGVADGVLEVMAEVMAVVEARALVGTETVPDPRIRSAPSTGGPGGEDAGVEQAPVCGKRAANPCRHLERVEAV